MATKAVKDELNMELISDLLELDEAIYALIENLRTRPVYSDELENRLDHIRYLCRAVLFDRLGQEMPEDLDDEDCYDRKYERKVSDQLQDNPTYEKVAKVLRPIGSVKNRKNLIKRLKRIHDAAWAVYWALED